MKTVDNYTIISLKCKYSTLEIIEEFLNYCTKVYNSENYWEISMAEFQNGRESDDDYNFREIIEKDVGGSLPALLDFDERRNGLYDRLAQVAVEIDESRDRHGETDIKYEGIKGSFKNFLKELYGSITDHDTRLEVVARFIKTDSDERIHMMRGFLGDDNCLEEFEQSCLEDILNHIIATSETVDDVLNGIAELYEDDLLNDIDVYMGHLISMHLEKLNDEPHSHDDDEVQTLEIKKSVGEHVVDVAKIAAGVSIALAVDRLLRRFK